MSVWGRLFGGRRAREERALRQRVAVLAGHIDTRVPELDRARSLAAKLELLDELLAAAAELAAIEARGLPTISPPPSAILPAFQRQRSELIQAEIASISRKAIAAAEAAEVAKRAPALEKALRKAGEWQERLPAGEHAAAIPELKALLHVARLEALVEKARRSEFEGQPGKARDLYQEALYLVLHDGIPDAQQQEEIQALEAKLHLLDSRGRD